MSDKLGLHMNSSCRSRGALAAQASRSSPAEALQPAYRARVRSVCETIHLLSRQAPPDHSLRKADWQRLIRRMGSPGPDHGHVGRVIDWPYSTFHARAGEEFIRPIWRVATVDNVLATGPGERLLRPKGRGAARLIGAGQRSMCPTSTGWRASWTWRRCWARWSAGSAARLPRRSRVYFEEWDEPMISGVGWVSELIRIADGEDCFPELAGAQAARYRVIADPAQAMAAQS